MSLLDQVKGWLGKGKQAAQEHQPQVSDAIDKAGKVVDDKTGGKHTDKIEKAQDAAKKALGGQLTRAVRMADRHHACDPAPRL